MRRNIRALGSILVSALAALALSLVVAGCPTPTPSVDCGDACDFVVYNSCTCGPTDPCNWISDGYCDTYTCASVTSDFFDDSADCGDGGACGGDCGVGYITECTCGADDPCGWIDDGWCDTPLCNDVAGGIFDDFLDCSGAGGLCDGACAAGQYTGCTCGSDDPCGWVSNGVCDRSACATVGGDLFDDSTDCSGGGGEHTFGVTAVRDDLDNNDLDIMSSGLAGLGYELVVRDLNVTAGALDGYFGQSLTTLYHTGHGFEEGIATSDGVLYVEEIGLGVENAVIATCLALVDNWNGSFGNATQTVLGYNKVSFDFIDDDVANALIDGLGAGYDYPTAWYLANSNIYDLSDRWVIYARQGGDIVEYSARSGATPQVEVSAVASSQLRRLGRHGRLRVAEGLLASTEVHFLQRTPVEARVVSDATVEARVLREGWLDLDPSRGTRDEAIATATAFVEARLSGLPADAALSVVDLIEARREGETPLVIAHVVRWERRIDGLAVRGNLLTDHLSVVVGACGVNAWSRYWPEVSTAADAPSLDLLSAGAALRRAADEIDRTVKGELRLVSARAVLGTLGAGRGVRRFIPAWELESDDGASVVVDAITGHVLR